MNQAEAVPIEYPAAPPMVEQSASTADNGRIVIPILIPRQSCAQQSAHEIVVCAKDPEEHRLRPLPDRFKPDEPMKAAVTVGKGISLKAEGENTDVGGNTNRMMIRGKIRF